MRKAFVLNPKEVEALVWIGWSYWTLSLREVLTLGVAVSETLEEQARKVFEKVLEIDPKNIQAHIFFGHVNYNHRNYDLAISAYKKALEIEPENVEALQGLANTLDLKSSKEEE